MTGLEPTSLRSQLPQSERWRKVKVNALLILVTMIWGSTFLIVQQTIRLTDPFTFLAMRFSIGALVLAVIFRKRLAQITYAEIITGSIIGLFLFGTYALQTIGLQYTTSSKAAFITAMYVPLVAILAVPMLHQKPTLGSLLGVMLSVTGVILISVNSSFRFTFGLGEFLVMGCAIASALHVILISKFAPRVDAINLALVQIAFTAILSIIAMPIAREPFVLPPLPVWGSALFMGVAATAFALATMNRVQQFVSSTQATLIYALEPVWAAMLGYLAGEQLSLFAWIGCGCILLGMITGELRLSRMKKINRSASLHASRKQLDDQNSQDENDGKQDCLSNKPAISILAECIANHPDQDNEHSAEDRNISQAAANTLRTHHLPLRIEDKTQRDDDSAQQGQQHLVRNPDNPLISLAIAYIHEHYQDNQDNAGDNDSNIG
jgi:drug/metabolite transporter (DMT)-like permease